MRIAHISDIHIHKRKGLSRYNIFYTLFKAFNTRIDLNLLDVLISDLKALKEKNELNHVVITGDITNTNHSEEFKDKDLYPIVKSLYSLGVDLILHGHRHYPFNWEHKPTPLSSHKMTVICVPSVACVTQDHTNIFNAYNIYQIEDNKVIVRQRGYINGQYKWLE